jgi:hypothetical protein
MKSTFRFWGIIALAAVIGFSTVMSCGILDLSGKEDKKEQTEEPKENPSGNEPGGEEPGGNQPGGNQPGGGEPGEPNNPPQQELAKAQNGTIQGWGGRLLVLREI